MSKRQSEPILETNLPAREEEQRMATDSYGAIYHDFRWDVPAEFNIAQAVCGRWACR